MHPDDIAVRTHQSVFDVERVARAVGPEGFREDPLAVLGVQDVHPQLRVGEALLRRVSGEPLVLGTDVQRRAVLVDRVHVDDDRHLFHQGAVPLLGLAYSRLRFLVLGDVEDDALPAQRLAPSVPQQHGFVMQPQGVPVTCDGSIVLAPAIVEGGGGVRGDDPVAIVRVQPRGPDVRIGLPLLGREAVHLLDLRTDVKDAAGGGFLDVGDRGELIDEAPESEFRLATTFLGVTTCRDVLHHSLPDHAFVPGLDHDRAVVHPDHRSVLAHHPVLDVEGPPGEIRTARIRDRRLSVFGVQDREPEIGRVQPFVDGEAGELLDGGAHVLHDVAGPAGLARRDVRHHGKVLHQRPVAMLRVGEALLGLLLPCDVVHHAVRS